MKIRRFDRGRRARIVVSQTGKCSGLLRKFFSRIESTAHFPFFQIKREASRSVIDASKFFALLKRVLSFRFFLLSFSFSTLQTHPSIPRVKSFQRLQWFPYSRGEKGGWIRMGMNETRCFCISALSTHPQHLIVSLRD